MAEASSHQAQWTLGNILKDYITECHLKLFLQKQPDKKPEDFTSDFYDTLQLSYYAASSHKNNTFTEGSRKLLEDIEDRLSDLYKKVTEGKTNFNDILALATSYCNTGILLYNSYKYEENRLRSGKTHLKRSLELLNGKEVNRRAILIVMRASMQLEYICQQLKEPMECCPFTHKAIGFYLEYTTQLSSIPMPFVTLSVSLDVEDSETDSDRNTMNAMKTLYLELLEHVQTCEFLAWDPLDLIPIHKFLMNRWTVILDESDVLQEGIAWVSNSTAFYQYFLSKYRFNDARNYLAATQYILDEYEEEFNAAMKAKLLQENENTKTIYCTLRMHLDQVWAKYGNVLLLHSKFNLFYSQTSRTQKDTSRSTSSIKSNESAEPVTFTWENLDERIKDIAKQVTDKNVSTLKDAKVIFKYTIKRFEKNKAHFLKSGNEFLYTFAAQNVALTYKYLEYFNPDRNMRIKMHNQRVRMLKEMCLVRKGSTEPKLFVFECNRDIIISCSAIIDLMMENVEIADKPFTKIATEVLKKLETCVDACNVLQSTIG